MNIRNDPHVSLLNGCRSTSAGSLPACAGLRIRPSFCAFEFPHRDLFFGRCSVSNMMMPLSRPPSPLVFLIGIALTTLGTTVHGQSAGSASFEIVSPGRVVDVSTFPGPFAPFSEFYTLPVGGVTNSEPTDYWILREIQSHPFSTEDGGVPDEDDEEESFDYRHIARYEAINSGSRRVSERGMVAWRFAAEDASTISATGTIGFIRASRRPSQLDTEPVVGHFTGAHGELSWETKAIRRNVHLTLTGAAYDPDATFEDYISLNHSASGVTVGGFEFPIPGSMPPKSWHFASNIPESIADGVFLDVLQRSDALEAEDVPDSAIAADPQDFWSRIYFFLLRDDRDSDRDGVADYADLTESVPTYPWYADYDWGNNWYYIAWMNTAVYSDRRVSSFWDYNLALGWNYVPPTSDRKAFWTYVHSGGLGWMFTSETWFPAFYRNSDGVYLYQTKGSDGSAEFYNYATGERETVQFN